MVRTGFGGGIPGVPTGSGGSDDDSDSSSGSGTGGSIPGAPDPDPDPDPAPDPAPDPEPDPDPTDEFGPELGGDPVSTPDPTGGGANERTGSTSPPSGRPDEPSQGAIDDLRQLVRDVTSGVDRRVDAVASGAAGVADRVTAPGAAVAPARRVDEVGGTVDRVVDNTIDTAARVREIGARVSEPVDSAVAAGSQRVDDIGETVDSVADRVVRDTQRASTPGGRAQNRRELVEGLDATADVTETLTTGGVLSETADGSDGVVPGTVAGIDVSEEALRTEAAETRQARTERFESNPELTLGGSDLPDEIVTGAAQTASELTNPAGLAVSAETAVEVGTSTPRAVAEEGLGDVVETGAALGVDTAAETAASARANPGGFAGGALFGAVAGGVASRGLTGLRRGSGDADADVSPDTVSVPSGRAEVGTGGRGSILADVDVDAERGVSGPSTRARVEGEVSRTADDVTERVGGFLDAGGTDRGQLQLGGQGRGTGDRDFGDAGDRTRPADAGGTFADVRQDALTQTQDALRDQAVRPDPGTFDPEPSPFRPGGGDTIDPDGGVSLQRGAGIIDDADADAALGSTTAAAGTSGSLAVGAGLGAGLGSISPAADPTGIADTDTPAGSALEPAEILGVGTGSPGAETDVRNDPTSVAPGAVDELGGGRVGGGTVAGAVTGLGVRTDAPADTAAPSDTGVRVDERAATTTDTAPATDTVASEADAALGTSTLLGDPALADGTLSPLAPGLGGGRDGPAPRPRPELDDEDDDEAAGLLGFASTSDQIDSGIASAEELASGLGAGDPFSL